MGLATMRMKNTAALLEHFSADAFTEPADIPAFTPVLSECLQFLDGLPAAGTVAAGKLLIEQGRAASSVQLIETGLVKLVHVNACGREVMIGLRSEGWYAGYTSAVLKTLSAYSVRAVTPCRVVRIPAADFPRCLKQSPEMLGHLLSVLCLEVASQGSMQMEMMCNSAEDRLERFMRERMTNPLSHKTLDPLPVLKQTELAQLLAVTLEHLSRLIKKKKHWSSLGS